MNGFLSTLFLVLAPLLVAMLSVALLTTWYTALLLVTVIGLIIYKVRYIFQPSKPLYDDHREISEERRKELLEVILKNVED